MHTIFGKLTSKIFARYTFPNRFPKIYVYIIY